MRSRYICNREINGVDLEKPLVDLMSTICLLLFFGYVYTKSTIKNPLLIKAGFCGVLMERNEVLLY
jgi:hypothetical protein